MDAYTGQSYRSALFSPHQSGANTPLSPFYVRWNSTNSQQLDHTASEPESALERAASPLLPEKLPSRKESDVQLSLPPLPKSYERLPSSRSLPPESRHFDPDEMDIGNSTFTQALFNGEFLLDFCTKGWASTRLVYSVYV